MARTTYTEQQRQHALELYTDHGPAEAARRTGIPAGTIRQWALRAGVTVTRQKRTRAATEAARMSWELRRGELLDDIGALAAELVASARGRIALIDELGGTVARLLADGVTEDLPEVPGARDVQALLTALGIAVDKAQLLSGGATSRGEVVSTDERRQRVQQLQAELERRGILRSVG